MSGSPSVAPRRSLIRRAVAMLPFVILWLALWGNLSAANVLSGVAVAVVVTLVFPLTGGDDRRFDLLATLKFLAIFVWLLISSTWAVVVAVFVPRGRVVPGLFEVTLRTNSSRVTTVVANAITLTPGTLTVEVKPGTTNTLVVHALDCTDLEALRASVVHLEDLAVASFPPPRTPRPGTATGEQT